MDIKKRRKRLGLTQREMSEKLGVKQNTLSQYEKGKREPGINMLRKLADLFGCTIDDLLRETQEGADEKVLEVLEDEEE